MENDKILINTPKRYHMVDFSHLTPCPTTDILEHSQLVNQAGKNMAAIIRNTNFTRVSKGVRPDTKKRVVLPKELVGEDVIYHIYCNASGQILLDPQVTIPASEAWVFNNPEILASLKQGLSDAAEGRVSRIEIKDL
jgi:hypothetical protein